MINEARRAQRRNAQEPMVVVDAMTEKAVGHVGNISETGMLLVAHAPLQEDAIYQLRFDLTDRAGRAVPLEVGAHLLWIGDANTPGHAWAGLRFLTIGEHHLEALRGWIGAGSFSR
ncbi:MAG TPA: PilZ domain-containing protein [Pseudoxanthomonas sp.]|nr:PilZ domain-containing protein [Pseudoxanthomonas sp.]